MKRIAMELEQEVMQGFEMDVSSLKASAGRSGNIPCSSGKVL